MASAVGEVVPEKLSSLSILEVEFLKAESFNPREWFTNKSTKIVNSKTFIVNK